MTMDDKPYFTNVDLVLIGKLVHNELDKIKHDKVDNIDQQYEFDLRMLKRKIQEVAYK